MRNKLYITIFTIMSTILGGCEGGLEPEIYDNLTGDNFPKTEADAKTLVYSVYYQFRHGEWNRYNSDNQSRLVQGLFCTDEFTCHWNGYHDTPFNFHWQPDQFPFSDMYYMFVPAVTTATSAMAQLRKMENVLGSELLKRYIAEIKVARAYFMYDLYNLYGPVSVITKEEDAVNINDYTYQPRPTSEEMVKLIEADLTDEIISILPEQCEGDEYGRMDQGAAQMCKLKLYLHEKNWQGVIDCADKIKALGYGLEPVYKDIWSIDNEQNNEITFPLVCKPSPEGVANNFRAHVLPPDWVSEQGLPSQGWNGYKVPWEFYDTFDKVDKRRETLVRYYKAKKGETTETIDAREKWYGAIPLKYSEDPAGTDVNQGVDYIVYRYADVILAKAEALNEINGPTKEAIDLINDIRERAFPNMPEKLLKLEDFAGDKDKLREHILKERGWELCFEGCRREDLIRHGKFVEYANDPKRNGADPDCLAGNKYIKNPQGNAKSHHVLYPIPNKAIVESNGVLKQNEGY